MEKERLFLIDGMSHIYRAYYAVRHLSNPQGLPTGAVFGFTSMLRKLIEEQKPDYIGVAIDLEGPTVRHEQFADYKATRKPMPEDLIPQLPYIRRVCAAFRVPVIGLSSYEADDVIGTLSQKASDRNLHTIIVTSDKDMLQLVADDVTVLDTMKDNLFIDAAGVEKKLGVRPDQVADLLGLWGDASDNIPGAPGIGEKGARELISTFDTLDNLLGNWSQVKKKAQQESLRDNQEVIRMSRELAVIKRDLPIALNLEELALGEPDRKAAFELFSELGFKSLTEEFLDKTEHKDLEGKRLAGGDASNFLSAMRRAGRVFVDLQHAESFDGQRKPEAACVIDDAGQEATVLDLSQPAHLDCWRQLTGDDSVKFVCWDAKLFLERQALLGIRGNGRTPDDLMLMAFLTAPNTGDFSLKRWAMDEAHVSLAADAGNEAGGDVAKKRQPKQASFLLAEPEIDIAALARRVDALRRLYGQLNPRLDEMNLRKLYEEIDLPLAPVLAEMEHTGIKVDRATLKSMSATMGKSLAEMTGRIYQSAGMEFNINSPKQLGEILFEKLNLPVAKKTRKTGGYSTDSSVLEELAQTYELPRLILEYRQVAKLKSTYVDALPELISPDSGRVHTSFHQTGAATGRLSSSNPNLQNIPIRTEMGRLIRAAFVPEKGNLLISADYSQVELRVLAHLSQDEVLIDAFRAGEDIHDRTAREVFSAEELGNRSECRRRAKAINFGIVYGQSAFGLAQSLGIGRHEAQAFIDAYFKRYRGVRAWLDGTMETARQTGVVTTLYGRVRQIPDINSRNFNARGFAERIAVNSPIQGTAADIVKIAMIRVERELRARQMAAKILLQVHDELVLEAPEAEVAATSDLLREEMEGAAELLVPLKVDLNVADNWMDMK
ncbi:MAG: DNA polymerase I [Acidobacteriota bacterium]|jgi:DNA polymerase-1|nr:DNA polymerase I [Acidobacteriota bacterium]